mgnify:CR=1 FL=1
MCKEVNVVCNVDFFIGQPLFLIQRGAYICSKQRNMLFITEFLKRFIVSWTVIFFCNDLYIGYLAMFGELKVYYKKGFNRRYATHEKIGL